MKQHKDVAVLAVAFMVLLGGWSTVAWISMHLASAHTIAPKPAAAIASDAPPTAIKIGPYYYAVRFASKAELSEYNAYALSDHDKREILLDATRVRSLRGDVLHEVLHAAASMGTGGSRLGPRDNEESIVEAETDALLSTLQENPSLVAWLVAKPAE
jgi:hypothetical protein